MQGLAPCQVPLARSLGDPRHSTLAPQQAGRAGLCAGQRQLQPPRAGSGAVTAAPSHRPPAPTLQAPRAPAGGGGLGRGSRGLPDPPQGAGKQADRTALPRAGPSPRWLQVDEARRTCKMATGSRQNEPAGTGPPSGPLPPEGPQPSLLPHRPGPGLPSPVLPRPARALV